ncbi:uncharacterized protein LOC123369507 [Mauremys mutica]|uniref:uncharacterized protein LOC123369507 n=1 Tax=Mauremys mutica TaxID=74926 RepID=UPI001D13E826|nr:uncharacterized protein LOC123369507 [Mauremys mutica]
MASRTGLSEENPSRLSVQFACPWRTRVTDKTPEDELNHFQHHVLLDRGEAEAIGWNCIIGEGHLSRTYAASLTVGAAGCLLTCHMGLRLTPTEASDRPTCIKAGEAGAGTDPVQLWKGARRILKAAGGTCPSTVTPPRLPSGGPAHELVVQLVQELEEGKKSRKLLPDQYKSKIVASTYHKILGLALDKLTVVMGALASTAREMADTPEDPGTTQSLPATPSPPSLPTPKTPEPFPPPYPTAPSLYPTLPSLTPEKVALNPAEAMPVQITRTKVDPTGAQNVVFEWRTRSKAEMKEFIKDTGRGPNEPVFTWLGRLILEYSQELIDQEEATLISRSAAWSRGTGRGVLLAAPVWPISVPAAAFLQIQNSAVAFQLPPSGITTPRDLIFTIAGASLIWWEPAQNPLGLTLAQQQLRSFEAYCYVTDPAAIPIQEQGMDVALDSSPLGDTSTLLWMRGFQGRPVTALFQAMDRLMWPGPQPPAVAVGTAPHGGKPRAPKTNSGEPSKNTVCRVSSISQKLLAVALGWHKYIAPEPPPL